MEKAHDTQTFIESNTNGYKEVCNKAVMCWKGVNKIFVKCSLCHRVLKPQKECRHFVGAHEGICSVIKRQLSGGEQEPCCRSMRGAQKCGRREKLKGINY